jgi:predicted phosphoadenosine phosphosulfate sulfurtransferase
MPQFLKFILEMKLCMFQTVPMSIIRSYSLYTQQWCMSYRSVDNLRAGSGWNILILLETRPKYVQFHFQNKFDKLVHLVGFIYKEIC